MAEDSYRVLLKRAGDGGWRVVQAEIGSRAPSATETARESAESVEVVDADGAVLSRLGLEAFDAYQEVCSPDGTITLEPRAAMVVNLPIRGDAARLRMRLPRGRPHDYDLGPLNRLRARVRRAIETAREPPAPALERLGGPDPSAAALQLNFIGDGFLEAELPAYREAVAGFWAKLMATPPFDQAAGRILGVRMDVVSDVSGISIHLDPDERTEQQGYEDSILSGQAVPFDVSRDTPFKASLAQPRLIVVDTANAQRFARDHVETAAANVTVVVANTRLYGGSGAEHVPVFSLSAMSADIAIHELGHAAFGLADEYSSRVPGAPLSLTEPNVDGDFQLGALKWAHLVNVAPSDLGVDHPILGPGPHIGAFEGAKYQPTGAYRPEFDCRMRTVNQPFCAVCREAIEKRLS